MANQSNFTAALNIFLQKVWTRSSSKNSFNSYWNNIITKDPLLESVYLTIDVIWGGNVRQLISTSPISTVSEKNSKTYNYLPLLQGEPSINSEYSMGNAAPSQRSLTITFDGREINPMQVVLSGDALAGFAELSLQVDNGDYDKRYVLMRGDMSGGVSFAEKEQPVTTDIVDPSYTSDAIMPSGIATKEEIPTLPDSSVGKRYPLIFDSYPLVPCIRMSEFEFGPSFVACSGRDHTVTKVYINGNLKEPTDEYRGYSLKNGFDNKNNPILIIEFVTTSELWESGDTVYAEIERLDKKERPLLEIIREIIIKSSLLNEVSLDEQLFFRAQTKLVKMYPKCLVNGSGSSNTTRALEYIQKTLLSDFPMVSMTFTGRGYGPIVTDRRSEIIVMDLIARQSHLYDRVSEFQESSKTSLKNTFVLKYNYNCITDSYDSISVRNQSNSPLCRISEDMFGRYDGDVMESVSIFDDKTANAVLDWLVSHYTLPHYYVEYEGSPALYFQLLLGDNVYLTDDKLGISQQKSTVTKIEYSRGKVVIGFQIWFLYNNISTSTAYGSGGEAAASAPLIRIPLINQ